jgi:Uma2 family endonuclease
MTRPGRMLGDAELRRASLAEQIMHMSAVRSHAWTIAEVEQLIEERNGMVPRYELVRGELLVTPAPSHRHQRIILHLALALHAYLLRERIAEIRLGPGELRLSPNERFEPDLFVLAAPDGRLPGAHGDGSHPLLVCEVLSPGSSRHDRVTKRRAFQQNGVAEYWVIDGDAEVFEIWHAGDERPAVADERVVWRPNGAATDFELDVRRFFAQIADHAPLP